MAGSKSSKKVEPWQTPEWRAHCAAERQRFRDGLFYQLMAPVMGPVIVDLNGSDEEMWRKVHYCVEIEFWAPHAINATFSP